MLEGITVAGWGAIPRDAPIRRRLRSRIRRRVHHDPGYDSRPWVSTMVISVRGLRDIRIGGHSATFKR